MLSYEDRKKLIGSRIKAERDRLDLTQGDFLERIYLSRSSTKTLTKWERGECVPDLDSLAQMAEVFSCDIGYLLGDYNERTRDCADVCKITGLSEKAVNSLEKYKCADAISAIVTQPEFEEIATLLKRLLDTGGLDRTNTKNHVTGIWERGMHGKSYYSEDIGDSIKYRIDTQFRYILDRIYQYWRDYNG